MRLCACVAVLVTTASSLIPPVRPPASDSRAAGLARGVQEEAQQNSEPAKEDTKYFHEPGQDDQLGHYDIRFFTGVVSYEERTETQLHMIRAYLEFFDEQGLDTWIAHGTLLGWWWNGKRLPWDWDMDTQVAGSTLQYLGRKYNQSMHEYIVDSPHPDTRQYLLDVNPWIWERLRGDGMNIIDARWIDVRNGLFIDITGLSETHPDRDPGVWSCKNYHHYRVSDLYPLRETLFEGVSAKVPYAYDRILVEEYEQKALVVTEYEGHVWSSTLREWVPNITS